MIASPGFLLCSDVLPVASTGPRPFNVDTCNFLGRCWSDWHNGRVPVPSVDRCPRDVTRAFVDSLPGRKTGENKTRQLNFPNEEPGWLSEDFPANHDQSS